MESKPLCKLHVNSYCMCLVNHFMMQGAKWLSEWGGPAHVQNHTFLISSDPESVEPVNIYIGNAVSHLIFTFKMYIYIWVYLLLDFVTLSFVKYDIWRSILLYLFFTVFSLCLPTASPLDSTLLISSPPCFCQLHFRSTLNIFMWKLIPSPLQHKHGSATTVRTSVVNYKHEVNVDAMTC